MSVEILYADCCATCKHVEEWNWGFDYGVWDACSYSCPLHNGEEICEYNVCEYYVRD